MTQKWIYNNTDEPKTFQGREISPDSFYFLDGEALAQFAYDQELLSAIIAGEICVSWNGSDLFTNLWASIDYLQSQKNFASSWAVDKNDDSPQIISTSSITLITAQRKLWDLQNEYSLLESKFIPSLDGIWNLNGSIMIENIFNVERVRLHIFRNGEIWFTVSDVVLPNSGKRSLPFSCDVDAYASSYHEFDLRIELTPAEPSDPLSVTISGSDEETSWGMSFIQVLAQSSPT